MLQDLISLRISSYTFRDLTDYTLTLLFSDNAVDKDLQRICSKEFCD
jgi:hypothetical protein